MKTIRRNTFETNSSSTHSLTLCEADVYDRIGIDYFICNADSVVVSIDEIKTGLLETYKGLSQKDVNLLWDAFLEHLDQFKDVKANIYDYDSSPEDVVNDLGLDEEEYFTKYFNLSPKLKKIFNEQLLDYMDMDIYDEQNNESGLEWYSETYTTRKGDKVIAFGYYGYPN